MVCWAKIVLVVHRLVKIFPKFRGELGSSIWHDLLGYSMWTYYPGHVQLDELSSRIRRPYGNEMSILGQTIHDDPYGVIPCLSMRQPNYEIHSDFFPFPFWDPQWLQQSGWPLVFCLDSLACMTQWCILYNISLHVIQPISGFHILLHHGTTGMNWVHWVMRFSEN
jgi:hypothetical protein